MPVARGLETLINWVEGPADIEGVGEQTVRLLWEKELAPLASRPLPPRRRSSCSSSKASPRSPQARRSTPSRRRRTSPFSRVLFGLNIPKLGWVSAQSLARHFGDVDRLLAASQEEVQEVDGFGPDRAEIIVEWFEDEQNRALVEELRSLGLRFELGEEDKPKEGPLTGKTYVITGTLERWSREQAAAALEAAGREGHELGLGEDDGADRRRGSRGVEAAKAQKAGVEQLDEAALESGYWPARTCAKRSCASRAYHQGIGFPFWRIEKTYRVLTKPESADAESVVPVFAYTCRYAGPLFMRSTRVPLTPAVGRESTNAFEICESRKRRAEKLRYRPRRQAVVGGEARAVRDDDPAHRNVARAQLLPDDRRAAPRSSPRRPRRAPRSLVSVSA